jgi:hypothetical protein
MASYGTADPEPPGFDDYPNYTESAEPESPPAPWYRNRSLLAVWATMVAILVVLIIYGLIQLSHGGGGGSSTTTPSTTSTPTRSSTPATTTPPPPATTSEEGQPPQENSPAPAEPPAEPPRHHHHLPHIPSTITLPHTVITLPPGF